MMSTVSRASDSNGRVDPSEDGASVLANLPRTRPQRSTARRAASRRRTSSTASAGVQTSEPGAEPAAATPARGSRARRPAAAKPARKAAKPQARNARQRAVIEEVPRQGFECEEDRATGSVPPPGGAELLSTAFEALSEIAKAGVSGGERVLRDVLSRLPR
jgi:hypothetical protein